MQACDKSWGSSWWYLGTFLSLLNYVCELMVLCTHRRFSLLEFKRNSLNYSYPSQPFSNTFISIRGVHILFGSSPRITGLSRDTMFGFKIPFGIHTCGLLCYFKQAVNILILDIDAAVLIVASQVTYILQFFLRRNIRIARDRAWAQTVASRGKGPDFWQPYVEEWQNPPSLDSNSMTNQFINKRLGGWFGRIVVKRSMFSDLDDDVTGCNFDMG